MANRNFSILLESTKQARPVLTFSGYLDRSSQAGFAEVESQLLKQTPPDLVIDLAAIEGMDGAGLQALTIFLGNLRKSNCRLTATSAPPWLVEVLRLTRLDSILTIEPAGKPSTSSKPAAVPPVNQEWCSPLTHPDYSDLPPHAIAVNTRGRLPRTPFSGFGPLCQRTYRVALPGVDLSPLQVMAAWKANFSGFWPSGNELLTPGAALQPGLPAVIHLSLPGGMKIFTGAVIMHANADSFSLMTLQGHMFCGWITFSSFIEDGALFAQTQALLRPADPLFDLSFRLGFGTRAEDAFWHASLLNLAAHLGVKGEVVQTNLLLDKHVQREHFGNLWYNAGIRSVFYLLTHPFAARKLSRREHP
jgi:anti-anti-sigma factor